MNAIIYKYFLSYNTDKVPTLTFQINRKSEYTFSANITVEGCTTQTMWGQYCNQTIYPLSCSLSGRYNGAENSSEANSYNRTMDYGIFCKNDLETSCQGEWEPKFYSLDVVGISQELNIVAVDVWLNETSSNNTRNGSDINLMCFARHGALPSESLHDYSSNINKNTMVINFPKVGRWYITILPVNFTKVLGGSLDTSIGVCYSMEVKLLECPLGKAGANCTWETYTLQVGFLIHVSSASIIPKVLRYLVLVVLSISILKLVAFTHW